ncbi:MAG: hypothetical protein IJX23_03485 [Clostridia bacterium]|nr:hypothetical protein [Clostridia bacterium]
MVIFVRLAYIQVVWGKDLQQKASDQWQRDLPIKAYRGDIVDTNGSLLATTQTSYGLYVRPQSVTDAHLCAKTLAEILQKDYQKLYDKITSRGVSEVTLANTITSSQVEAIRNCNLQGIYIAGKGVRSYVYGDFLSQVLGFVSSDGIGQTGIESYYNKYLQGIDGKLLTETDLVGEELKDGAMSYISAVNGLTVTLTIDAVIQTIVENVLQLAMHQQSPQGARCIVLDVTTGEILAMASKPSVDLNNLPRDDLETLMKYSKNTLLTDI